MLAQLSFLSFARRHRNFCETFAKVATFAGQSFKRKLRFLKKKSRTPHAMAVPVDLGAFLRDVINIGSWSRVVYVGV